MSGKPRILDLSPIKLGPMRTFSFAMDFTTPSHWSGAALRLIRRSHATRRKMARNQTLRRIYVNPGIKLVRVSAPRYAARVLG